MITKTVKTEITIWKTQRGEGAGELVKIAAMRGLDVTKDSKGGWLIGDGEGRIYLEFDNEDFWYVMVIFNDAGVQDAPATITVIETPVATPMNELAQLALDYVNNLPIDARKWSKATLNRAYIIGLIEKGSSRKWQFANHFDFSLMMDAPALWALTKDMIEAHSGYSITTAKGWNKLNIYCKSDTLFSNRDIEDIERILNTLAAYGYIWFNGAGSVWHITIQEQGAKAA